MRAHSGYVHAQFRFAMHPTFDATRHLHDPDLPLPWHDVAQVLVPTSSMDGMAGHRPSDASFEATHCPICLGAPSAPRMTRCGHVYCYSCILHYLLVTEQAPGVRGAQRHARRCPICGEDVLARDLKPVHWVDARQASEAHRAAFLAQLGGTEATGTAVAQGTLPLRLMQRHNGAALARPRDEDEVPDGTLPILGEHASACLYAHFVRATPKWLAASLQADLDSVDAEMAALRTFQPDELSLEFVRVAQHELRAQIDMVASLPEPHRKKAVSTVPPASRGATSAPSTYFFYQAASGQHVFLHPLDIKVLLSHFGSYPAFPDSLLVVVQNADAGTVDETLRKRCRYLAHLPLAADVTFVEVDWPQTVALLHGAPQSGMDLTAWHEALSQRQHRHHAKATREERAQKRAEKDAKRASRDVARTPGTSESDWPAMALSGDAEHLSFRESAMLGAEMYFPIHPGAAAEAPPFLDGPALPAPAAEAQETTSRTVWGTPAAPGAAPLGQSSKEMDEAWSALEADAAPPETSDSAAAQRRPAQRTKRKPKLVLTGGGRGAL